MPREKGRKVVASNRKARHDYAILDTYEAERRPVAEHNVARSADPNGSVREAADELHADLGGRLDHTDGAAQHV